MGQWLMELWKFHGWALLAGCVTDWIFGDPCNFPHPVRMMGVMIDWLEKQFRKNMGEHLKKAGILLAVFMCLFWVKCSTYFFQSFNFLHGFGLI